MTLADRMPKVLPAQYNLFSITRSYAELLESEPEPIPPALTVEAGPLIETFREFCAALWKGEIYGDAAVSAEDVAHLRVVAGLRCR